MTMAEIMTSMENDNNNNNNNNNNINNSEVMERPPLSSCSSSSSCESSESEEMQRLEKAPPFWQSRRRLSKQLSMCETPRRDIAWERRRRHILLQERRRRSECLTDDDLNELKGCIELGFGFKEEEGQRLCNTLPALDLYFAVNRLQYSSSSPVSTPGSSNNTINNGNSLPSPSSSSSLGGRSSSPLNSPSSDSDPWKICSPGDNPEHVKTKLRHWAQAVACSVMQSY